MFEISVFIVGFVFMYDKFTYLITCSPSPFSALVSKPASKDLPINIPKTLLIDLSLGKRIVKVIGEVGR